MRRDINQRITIVSTAVLALLGAMAVFVGCSDDEKQETQTVKHEINEDVDFSTYKTFDLVDPIGGETEGDAGVSDAGDAPLDLEDINAEILSEIETQMEGLGLTRDKADPDLMVSYFTNEDPSKTSVTFYDYFYGYYWGYEFTWTVNVEYDAGTLIIDVVDLGDSPDVKDDVLAFRGTAEGVLAQNQDVRLMQMRNAVDAVFKGWPSEE